MQFKVDFNAFSEQLKRNFSAISEQLKSSSGAVVEQCESNFRAVLIQDSVDNSLLCLESLLQGRKKNGRVS